MHRSLSLSRVKYPYPSGMGMAEPRKNKKTFPIDLTILSLSFSPFSFPFYFVSFTSGEDWKFCCASIEFSSGYFRTGLTFLSIFLIVLFSFLFQVRGHRSILSGRSSPVDHWSARKLGV